jgi:hypothetical protein
VAEGLVVPGEISFALPVASSLLNLIPPDKGRAEKRLVLPGTGVKNTESACETQNKIDKSRRNGHRKGTTSGNPGNDL